MAEKIFKNEKIPPFDDEKKMLDGEPRQFVDVGAQRLRTTCPYCREEIITDVEIDTNICKLFCMCCCSGLCLCWISFCMGSHKHKAKFKNWISKKADCVHYCPRCENVIGEYQRSGE